MIRQITDGSLLCLDKLNDSHYKRKIISNFDAYGLSYDFCRFFLISSNDKDIGIISLFNSSMTVETYRDNVLDSENFADISFMVRINKPSTIELAPKYSVRLIENVGDSYSLGERHEFKFVCKYGLPELDVNEVPKLDDVFDILKTGFPALVPVYDLWLTDTSHRIRRGYSQAFIYNCCTTATIQYIVDGKALIGQVATIPEKRGQHFARTLLYWIGERLGMDGITVYLFARNHRKSYYEEIGFKEISKDYVLDIKDELI